MNKNMLEDKKADDAKGIGFYIALLIGVIALVIIIVSISKYGLIDKINDLFPSFSGNKNLNEEEAKEKAAEEQAIIKITHKEKDNFYLLWDEETKDVYFKFELNDVRGIFGDKGISPEHYGSLGGWMVNPDSDTFFLNRAGIEGGFAENILKFVDIDNKQAMLELVSELSENKDYFLSFGVRKSGAFLAYDSKGYCEAKDKFTVAQIKSCITSALKML